MKYTQDSETRLQLPLSIDQSPDIVTTRGRIGFISGGGRGGGGSPCLWSRTITPPFLFPIHHTVIGNCLLKSISDGDDAAAANWGTNFLPPWKMMQDFYLCFKCLLIGGENMIIWRGHSCRQQRAS